MLEKVMVFIVLLVLMLTLVYFSPWMTNEFAEKRAIDEFEQKWEGVEDGCGICYDCGVTSFEDVPFGRRVTIRYNCGMAEQGDANFYTETYFVSFLGTVH